nr:integrin alpha ps [Hymenolepis microstoma]
MQQDRLAVACSPRLSYEVTGKLFVTGGCFAFNNILSDPQFLGASTCLNIPDSSRSLDLRFCLNGASASYFHNSWTDLIVSGSPYYRFARGIGLARNITEFSKVKKTDSSSLGDYSLLGSSSVISDRVYSSASDTIKPIVTVFGAPGVPQTKEKKGSGYVVLNVIDKNTDQIIIPHAQLLQGSRFGSRFGHAVALIDLNGDGGIGLARNITEFSKVKKTDSSSLGDYSLLGSSSVISDRVYSSASDTIKPIVTVFGAPGVPQTKEKKGSGYVVLNVIDKNTDQIIIPHAQLLQGSRFGSRFGHAVALIDLNGDGWDDLLIGAPFEQHLDPNALQKLGTEGRGTLSGSAAFGSVYIFWNQHRRLPSTSAFSDSEIQILKPPSTLSLKSGFGSAITALGDIDHDGIDDFAIGAPYDAGGGSVIIYHGSKDKKIGSPTQILNTTKLSGSIKSFGFSLSSGGLDLDLNGYPDLAVGAPESDKIVVFRTRPVIRVEVFVVLEDGSSHVEQKLDTLEDCTRDTQILPGYWAPRVHCMNLKVLATFTPVDPVRCSQQTIPIRLLLVVHPPDHWLKEDFSNITTTESGTEKTPVASLFGEKVLKVSDPEVRVFYQRSARDNGDNVLPENSDESLPFLLLLNSQKAICRDHSVPPHTPPTSSELTRAATVRLAFRDVNMVDLSSPLRFGVKWLLDVPSPTSPNANLMNYPINNPIENTGEAEITFSNECQTRPCNPILLPKFEYIVTRDKDGPVVFVGDDEHQTIEIRATVRNTGSSPSYATSIYTSYPESLLDLNTFTRDTKQRTISVKPGLALCHFGNPLPQRQEATCVLRFNVLGQQLLKASKNFTINSTISSSPKYPPKALAPLSDSITIKVKMSVNVSVTGEILPDAAYYSGNVTDGILANNGENKIGSTRLLVRVRIQNLRKHSLVPNSRLVIDWPHEIADVINEDNGKYLFYLLEKPYVTKTDLPSTSNSTITCDSRALDKLVNPYNYRVFKSLMPQPRGEPVATAPIDLPLNHPSGYPPLKSQLELEKMPYQGDVKRIKTNLTCYNGQLRCVPIVCDLGPLSYRAGVITFEMPARLWDNTMRQDFKDIFLTSVQMTATWRASVSYTIDAGDKEHASDDFELKIFNHMELEPVYPKNMPLYIGLAVFAGLLLLAILIIILWKAKFFERKKFKKRFQRGKNGTEDPKSANQEERPLKITNIPPTSHSSLHNPPISAYGDTHR